MKAVEQVAYHTGNFLLIGNGYHNEQKERQAIEQLIRHRCAALVVHAKMIPDAPGLINEANPRHGAD